LIKCFLKRIHVKFSIAIQVVGSPGVVPREIKLHQGVAFGSVLPGKLCVAYLDVVGLRDNGNQEQAEAGD
jgi:hypothetical protein